MSEADGSEGSRDSPRFPGSVTWGPAPPCVGLGIRISSLTHTMTLVLLLPL